MSASMHACVLSLYECCGDVRLLRTAGHHSTVQDVSVYCCCASAAMLFLYECCGDAFKLLRDTPLHGVGYEPKQAS